MVKLNKTGVEKTLDGKKWIEQIHVSNHNRNRNRNRNRKDESFLFLIMLNHHSLPFITSREDIEWDQSIAMMVVGRMESDQLDRL